MIHSTNAGVCYSTFDVRYNPFSSTQRIPLT